MPTIDPIYWNIIGALLAAYLVYRLGLRAYFKQKEYEHVRGRYLDQGYDAAAADIEYALGIYRNNWSQLLRYTKVAREHEGHFDATDFFEQFREIDLGRFQLIPAHRITALLKSDVIWEAYQHVFSFVATSNDTIKADFGVALRAVASHQSHPEKDKFIAKAIELADHLNKESEKHYEYLSMLHNIAQIFEKENYTRASITKFRERRDVKQILKDISNLYVEE